MSSRKSRLFAGLAAVLVVAACEYKGGGPDPGSIALSIATTSATVLQGGSQLVTATLTRSGGYSGSVGLYVTGQPVGVSAEVSDVQKSGAVTTITVSIVVGAGVAPAIYPLVVHGTGSGISDVTQVFTLTVDPDLGFSISLSAAALAIVQGASTPTTTVNISRVSHIGAVALGVTGLPTGVTASFDYSLPWLTGNSSILTLSVGTAVPPGIYPLQVNASDPEQEGVLTTPLTLTVTAPPSISLGLSSGSASVWLGNSSWLTVILTRAGGFTGSVSVTVSGAPSGVTATVYIGQISGAVTTAFVGIGVDAATMPGVYSLVVHGTGSGVSEATATFTLTTTVPGFTLTLSSPTLSIVRGAAMPSTTVIVARNNFTDPVPLYVDLGDEEGTLPPGVTAAFGPNPATGNSSVLTLTVGAAAAPGVYNLYVWGYTMAGYAGVPLTLTVTVP